MASSLRFAISHRCPHSSARVGRVTTPHGDFDTPAFMAVGTKANVKGLLPQQVAATRTQVVLNNTYHLMLRPGEQIVEAAGGAHRFMGWPGPILTDSGGYQAYSMADINDVDDDGVTFKSIINGAKIRMTPERSIAVQNAIGADIIMAFDDCPPSMDPTVGPTNQTRIRIAAIRDGAKGIYDHAARLRIANERTVRWLERCKAAHARAEDQALFGIVQGGTDLEARAWSAERITSIDLPGYAIGGVAVGELQDDIASVTRHTAALLPEDKPRYLMGVGYEQDIVAAVLAGVDMFDCVLPTRNARNGQAFVREGTLRFRNARHERDFGPIEAGCGCAACDPAGHGWATPDGLPFSRAYIKHLFMASEMLGPILLTLHNLWHFQTLMLDIRQAIAEDDWPGFAQKWPRVAAAVPGGDGVV
ncbi:MAG: tRNA guanosine(34) transglycosylase Tgt [Planctomycetota bacterium]|nr:MAG: tRNA guanosine(34) transglycosylase Tgt [Planctomycetota bacterium]